jgi:hypothetical protein
MSAAKIVPGFLPPNDGDGEFASLCGWGFDSEPPSYCCMERPIQQRLVVDIHHLNLPPAFRMIGSARWNGQLTGCSNRRWTAPATEFAVCSRRSV